MLRQSPAAPSRDPRISPSPWSQEGRELLSVASPGLSLPTCRAGMRSPWRAFTGSRGPGQRVERPGVGQWPQGEQGRGLQVAPGSGPSSGRFPSCSAGFSGAAWFWVLQAGVSSSGQTGILTRPLAQLVSKTCGKDQDPENRRVGASL